MRVKINQIETHLKNQQIHQSMLEGGMTISKTEGIDQN
jgi:hypothetical protein